LSPLSRKDSVNVAALLKLTHGHQESSRSPVGAISVAHCAIPVRKQRDAAKAGAAQCAALIAPYGGACLRGGGAMRRFNENACSDSTLAFPDQIGLKRSFARRPEAGPGLPRWTT